MWILGFIPVHYLGSLIAAVSGYATYRSTLSLFRPRPALELDSDGLVDRTSIFAIGRIPWDQIISISEVRGGLCVP